MMYGVPMYLYYITNGFLFNNKFDKNLATKMNYGIGDQWYDITSKSHP